MKLSKTRIPAACRYGLAAALTFLVAGSAIAQEVFEEIVVRAQRRDQSIMEVPVAVTAVTGAELQSSGIRDMFEIQQNVPGLIVGQSQTATTTNFQIRGIFSTSNNFGVESSVGLYVDEVYRSRQSSIINDLVDVEAVEVLRGPQGTLFGKNTPAGAIQIRTVAPNADSTNGYLQLEAGDYGLGRINGAVNIPLTDYLAFRGTIFATQRDGYVDDDTFGSDFHNDRDRKGVRLQLGYEPSDTFSMRIIADYSDIEETCCVALSRVDGLYSRASIAGVPTPGTDAVIAGLGGQIFTDFGYPQALLDPFGPAVTTGVGFDQFRVAYNQVPVSQNEDRGLSLQFDKTFDNGVTLTSITAVRAFDTFDFIDGDFTSADIFTRTNDATQDSFSQEFRLSGEFGEGGNWVAGLYYFGQEVKNMTRTDADSVFNPYFIAIRPDDLQPLLAGIGQLFAQLPPGTLPPPVPPFSSDTFALNDFTQDQDGWAAFGQVDIPLGEKFIATLGARYTDEEKTINGLFTESANGPPPDFAAIQGALFAASMGDFSQLPALLPVLLPNESWGSYLLDELSPRPDLNEKIADDQTTGTLKLSWFPSDSTMIFASYATGFKSGGTNTDRINPAFPQIFGPEKSKSIELGFKGDLGPVRLAASVYQTDFEDFQASTFTGTGFNLQNAGDVETKGFELEALWRPFDTFEVQAWYAYSKGEYKSFVFGTCWDTTPFHTGVPDPAPPGASAEQCDRTGDPLPYNPENRAFLALTKDFPVGNNNLFIRGEVSYQDEAFTDGDLDPLSIQDSFTIVNLRVGLDIESWNSQLQVWGRNITDERWYSGSFDGPIQLGRMNSYPSEPSTFGVTFRKDFD